MKLYYNKKEYTSVDELSRIFTNDYRVKITPHNVYQICCHYHLTPLYGKFDEYSKRVVPCERKDEDLAFFNDKLVWQIRHMKEDFTDVLDYVVNSNKYDAEWESEPLTDYTPNESNMEYVNNELMNKYQFEGVRRIIKLTENQFNRLFEGVEWSRNNNGGVNMSITQDKSDKKNIGGLNSVDTRVFGDRDEVLYGDGTASLKTNSLSQSVLSRRAVMVAYQNLITFINKGRAGNIDKFLRMDKNLPKQTLTTIKKLLENPDDEYVLNAARKNYEKAKQNNVQKDALYTRLMNSNDDKVTKYTKFTIPNTDVECIALFNMGNFDFSDAIKNGNLRSTSAMFNGDLSGYNVDSDGRIGVTYDDGIKPNLKQNFSLNGDITKDHFKAQYQLQNAKYDTNVNTADDLNRELSKNKKYTSVNQFLDKSIIYANYVLKQEHFSPDYIVSVPSSSKMNEYYSTNLSNKLGVEYVKDFFQRDIVHAHFANGVTDEDLLEKGFSPLEIEKMKTDIKNYCFREIAYQIETPLRNLVEKNYVYFSNISKKKYDRVSKASKAEVIATLSRHAFEALSIRNTGKGKYLQNHLCNVFLNETKKDYGENSNIFPTLKNIITMKIGKNVFNDVLNEMLELLNKFSSEIEGGYRYRGYGVKPSKITTLDKRYREFVEGSFIVASKNLNEDGELLSRYKTANFLIVDEDVNSGGSFKLVIDALKLKLPTKNSNNILCLANGFSENGR